MKYQNTWRGFTLIELLVVVLIIGILAAMAFPQYQKAVYKSHFIQLKVLTDSIAKAQEAYYLANGTYATDLDTLDLSIPDNTVTHEYDENDTEKEAKVKRNRYYKWGQCYTILSGSAVCRNENISMAYYLYLQNHPTVANKRTCVALNTIDTTSIQAQICQSETGDQNPQISKDHIIFSYK